MTRNIKVSEVMTHNVTVANVQSTYSQVMQFFTEIKIQHLPVAEGDVIIGIISVNDMLRFLAEELSKGGVDDAILNENFRITEVMTKNPISISPEDTMIKVVEVLSGGTFQALPVTEGGHIKGIVTNKDIVRMLHWDQTH